MSDEPSSDIQESVNKQFLLAEMRDEMSREGVPIAFINRLADLLDSNFSAEEMLQAEPPEKRKTPAYIIVAGMMTSIMIAVFWNFPDAGPLTFGEIFIASLAMIPFGILGYVLARRQGRSKGHSDDALVVYARLVPKTWINRGYYKQLRRLEPQTDADVDAYLRKQGWQGLSGTRLFIIVFAISYAIYLLTMIFQPPGS